MRRWKCTVCRYVHEGDAPPEICPVCKAGKDKFVEIDASGVPVAAAPPVPERPEGRIGRLVEKHHLHPIAVHVPNGVIPIAVLFAFASAPLGLAGLSQAAFYDNLCVALSMPAVLFTGYSSWRTKYAGARTRRFAIKIGAASVSALCSVGLVIGQFLDPSVLDAGDPGRLPFLLVSLLMLASAATAGFIGGKLVFRD